MSQKGGKRTRKYRAAKDRSPRHSRRSAASAKLGFTRPEAKTLPRIEADFAE
jgi:hypothetical protein